MHAFINTAILPKVSPLQLIPDISNITVLVFKICQMFNLLSFFLEKEVILSFHIALPVI